MKKPITFSSKGVPIARGIPRTMRLCVLLIISILGWLGLGNAELSAQISVTATAGTVGPTTYATLGAAFTAINAGTHQGAITINVSTTTAVETGSCVLNSSGAGTALYTSVLIQPAVDNALIAGATTTGRGVIELNGADNVTINGDNPNTACTNRNLTIQNTAAATITYTSAVRVALSTLITTANSNSIRNCIILGSATGRNISTATSATGSEHTTYGILVGGGASTVAATTAPSAIASVSTVIGTGITATSFVADNNSINACARGIAVNGSATTVANNLTIINNTIGSSTAGNTTTVYSRGMSLQGFDNTLIAGNTIQNMEWFVGTSQAAIHLGDVAGSGTNAIVDRNIINGVNNRNTGTFGANGIIAQAGANMTIRNNCVANITGDMTTGWAFSTTLGIFGIKLANSTGHKVYNNSVNLYGLRTGTATSSLLSAACAVTTTSITGCDIRNNIFSNTMTGGTTSIAYVSLFLPSAATSTLALTLNNNAYYTGTTSGIHGICHAGTTYTNPNTATAGLFTAANFVQGATTPATNLRAYTSTLGTSTNDNASWAFSTAAPFTTATDLHIPNGTTTVLESGGVALTSISPEMDNDIRPGPRYSLNGGGIAPDIGCDEFDGYRAGCSTLPTASIAASPVSGSTCANVNPNKVTLTASGGTTYDWSPSTGLSASTGATVDATPTSTTIYTVTVTDASGCKATATQLVDVPINLTVTATPTSVCASSPNTQLLAAVSDSCSYYKMSSITHAPIADPGGSTTISTWTGDSNDGASTAIALPFTF
ncbi:MAG TPA: hypothetical protein PK230_02810, partial [Chitinophagales bacterium]|nr:hypothetical protein [Chitinophagales bacterium]